MQNAALRSELEPLPAGPKASKRTQRRETLEEVDAAKRKRRRRSWREAAKRSDRRYAGMPASERRYRAAELVLATAAIAPATVEAFELLSVARDAQGLRLLSPSALKLLRSYMADADTTPREDGWLTVPPVQTQRQRADALDLSDRTLRNVNRDLIACGLLCPGVMLYCGDGVRVVRGSNGDDYCLELRRRVWLLAPAVAEMLGAPRASKAGNEFPAAFPDGAADATPKLEGDAVASPEIELGQLPSVATVFEGHELAEPASPSVEAGSALRARNDEAARPCASRLAASGGAEGRGLAPGLSTAGKGAPTFSLVAPSVPAAERAGGGDLQGRFAGGRRRPRRRR